MKRIAVFVVLAFATIACTNRSARVALPSPTIVSATPTPTSTTSTTSTTPTPSSIYDPNAPAGGGSYRSRDGRLRFSYPRPWFVEVMAVDEIYLWNYKLTDAEEKRRERNDVYATPDGEGYLRFSYSPASRTLEAIRAEECHEGDTTLRVRQCSYISLHGRRTLWTLMDVSDDSDCTCRTVYVIANGREYEFDGGACVMDRCPKTDQIITQIDGILRSVVVS